MGGLALKNIQTVRLDAPSYFCLTGKVLNQLKLTFLGCRVDLIPAYKTKKDFGDADFLVESSDISFDIRERIQNTFLPKQIVKNSNVWSFDVENFQIDIILTAPRYYNASLNYFSYNDLSNLEGRLFHKLGLKHGHDGLKYIVRDGTTERDEIELSLDVKEFLPLVGLDYNKRASGFDSLEDIFEYVSSSPYFNPDIYLLENRNHISRVRDKKRKTYQEFLKWCELNKSRLNSFVFEDNKDRYLPLIIATFPNFKSQYDKIQENIQKQKERAAKFNGNMVKELLSIEGKELGGFISNFKKSREPFNKYLDAHTKLDMICEILKYV